MRYLIQRDDIVPESNIIYNIEQSDHIGVELKKVKRGFFESKAHWVKRMHKMGIKVYGID